MSEGGQPGGEQTKDDYFRRVGALTEAMIAAHGKEFTMGTLILAARFIAEGKPLVPPTPEPEHHA